MRQSIELPLIHTQRDQQLSAETKYFFTTLNKYSQFPSEEAVHWLNQYAPLIHQGEPDENRHGERPAQYLAQLVWKVADFAAGLGRILPHQEAVFLAQIDPFLKGVRVGMEELDITSVVNAFFDQTSTPGALTEQMAVVECRRRLRKQGFTSLTGQGVMTIRPHGVPETVVATIMNRIANRPQSPPEVGEILDEIVYKRASLDGSRHLFIPLVATVPSPEYGVRAEKMIRQYYPYLDASQTTTLNTALTKRAINEKILTAAALHLQTSKT